MDIKDYFKKHGKQFLKSVAKYSKQKPKETVKTFVEKPKQNSIPNIDSNEQPKMKKTDYEKEFMKHFRQLTYRHRSLDVWSDFVMMFACAISNSVDKQNFDEREKLYLQIINKYEKEEQKVFPILAADTVMALEENQEQDFLGHIYMNLGLGSKSASQFFTPYHICQLMAEVSVNDVIPEVKEKGYISINDPCCGAGATLIAGINVAKRQLEKANMNYQNHVLVVAQDIDFTVAAMCYIQLSLLGVAGYVKVGNSLTEPITEKDDDKNYWFTPMYFSDIWHMRRIIKIISALHEEKQNE